MANPNWKKGVSGNPKGKPKGSRDAKTIQWESFSRYMMGEGLKKFEREMNKLEGKDYVMVVKDMMEYFKPKLARTELTGKDGDALIKIYDRVPIRTERKQIDATDKLPAPYEPVGDTGESGEV